MAYLVNMIKCVMAELMTFMFFYFIILYQFALIFGALGWHLTEDERELLELDDSGDDEGRRLRMLKGKGGGGGGGGDGAFPGGDDPGAEYAPLEAFLYNALVEFRMSMGDNDFGQIAGLG